VRFNISRMRRFIRVDRWWTSCCSWPNWWILSTGNVSRSLSMEERSDGNDVSTLGQNEDRPLSWRTSECTCRPRTRSDVLGMFRKCTINLRQKMFRAFSMRHSDTGYGSGQGHAVLSGSEELHGSQLHVCERWKAMYDVNPRTLRCMWRVIRIRRAS